MIKNVELKTQKKGIIRDVFLPVGFPHSVSEDYVTYQVWDSAQALCSSIMSALSANSVFKGIGVGDEGASALSATTNWILRQGLGKCASISFAYQAGSKMGADSKRYRLLADIVNDIALTVNLISAFLPYTIRPYVYAVSSTCWSIVGIAGSCTRTALTIHQARANNAADVQAKDQSQETLVELVGLVLSYVIVSVIGDSPTLVLSLFVAFMAMHLTCNFKAVKSVKQSTLNITRARLLVSEYTKNGRVPSVDALNRMEPVVVPLWTPKKITIGAKFDQRLNIIHASQNIVIGVSQDEVRVCLTESHTPSEVFDAMLISVLHETDAAEKELDLLKEHMKAAGYSFSVDHLVIEKFRISVD